MRRILFCLTCLVLFGSVFAQAMETVQVRSNHEPGEWFCLVDGGISGSICYYDDDVQVLNDFLQNCSPGTRVELYPGPRSVTVGSSKKSYRCTWMMSGEGFIEREPRRYSDDPFSSGVTITVFVGEDSIPLSELKMPDHLDVSGPADQRFRAIIGMENISPTIQARCAGRQVRYDPYNTDNVFSLVQLMSRSEDQHVRRAAAWALGRMGTYATEALPTLEWYATNDKANEQDYKRAIDKIVNGPDVTEKASAYAEAVQSIQLYIRTVRPNQSLDTDAIRRKPFPSVPY